MGNLLFLYGEVGTRASHSYGLGALDLMERKWRIKIVHLEIKSTYLPYTDVFWGYLHIDWLMYATFNKDSWLLLVLFVGFFFILLVFFDAVVVIIINYIVSELSFHGHWRNILKRTKVDWWWPLWIWRRVIWFWHGYSRRLDYVTLGHAIFHWLVAGSLTQKDDFKLFAFDVSYWRCCAWCMWLMLILIDTSLPTVPWCWCCATCMCIVYLGASNYNENDCSILLLEAYSDHYDYNYQ